MDVMTLNAPANIGSGQIEVVSKPVPTAKYMGWVVIDPHSDYCEVRRVNNDAGAQKFGFAPGLKYDHPKGNKVYWITDSTFSVKWWGATGDPTSGGDGPRIQAALDGIFDASSGINNGSATLLFPEGQYNIGNTTLSFKATKLGLILAGASRSSQGSRIDGSGGTIMLDFLGANSVVMRDMFISTVGTDCDVGLLLGRTSVPGDTTPRSGANFSAHNVTIFGGFRIASVYDINCEGVSWSHCGIKNRVPGSWAYYTSVANEHSVQSSVGRILEAVDGTVTNTNKTFDSATEITNEGDGGIGIGIYGNSRTINLLGTFLAIPHQGGTRPGKCIELGPAGKTVKGDTRFRNYGPVNVYGCQFEGRRGSVGIHLRDFNMERLNVRDSVFGIGHPPAEGVITQAPQKGDGLRYSAIRNCRFSAKTANRLERIADSELGEGDFEIADRADRCLFIDSQVSATGAGAVAGSTFLGRFKADIQTQAEKSLPTRLSTPRFGLEQSADLTVQGGKVTATGSVHRLDTNSVPAADLDTIDGIHANEIVVLSLVDANRHVTLRDKVGGNLRLLGDFTLDSRNSRIVLIGDGTNLIELCRSRHCFQGP